MCYFFSVLLHFKKISGVMDQQTGSVEQFISKLNQIFVDAQRRQLGTDKVEDQARCAHNGPDLESFDGSLYVMQFTDALGHYPVKSKLDKDASLLRNQASNASKRNAYSQDDEQRLQKQIASKLRYRRLVETLAKGRGSVKTSVRKQRKLGSKRTALAEGILLFVDSV